MQIKQSVGYAFRRSQSFVWNQDGIIAQIGRVRQDKVWLRSTDSMRLATPDRWYIDEAKDCRKDGTDNKWCYCSSIHMQ